ncbi:MAG: Tol-Pal system beta propeller repeat protein TolB [Gammaproteobacteria bacterium]|nr:Tol-Pal system beta propeller repeat protein TolB [Gammaproteobacteria bacterium]
MQLSFRTFVFLACFSFTVNAQAVLTIEITQGAAGAMPIAVVPFSWGGQEALPVDIAGIVSADLQRSGRFSPLAVKDMLSRPSDAAQVNYRDWRMVNVDHLVVGKVMPQADGYMVQFQLLDVIKQTQRAGYTVRSDRAKLRWTAHQIADMIYESLIGEPGAFATRIAFVSEILEAGKRKYSLQVADSDGFNARPILKSAQPLMSPAWSPDGNRLAYVSFETGAAAIYVQDVNTGRREIVSHGKGMNNAPSWSSDGRKLALVLSKDGTPEIYILDQASKQLRRMTNNFAIDTEPVWTPDGSAIVFTSDRGGGPQIYRLSVGSGETTRLTFEGKYNARPVLSPNGKILTFVHGTGNQFNIATLELATGNMQVLTNSQLDESPSFAPNGSMVIYATKDREKGFLSAVSVDGRVRQKLVLQEGQAREPAWSPYVR